MSRVVSGFYAVSGSTHSAVATAHTSDQTPQRFRSAQARTTKQDIRLFRLGFFDGPPATEAELEKAYTDCDSEVMKSSEPWEPKEMNLKKLASATRNIYKSLHNQDPSPSSDDEELVA